MKEVKFRWVDKYLIHMTLRAKFAVLAIIPIITLLSLAVLLNANYKQNLLTSQIAQTENFNQTLNSTLNTAYQFVPQDQQQAFLKALQGTISVSHQQSAPRQLVSIASNGGETQVLGESVENTSRIGSNGLISKLTSAQQNQAHNEYMTYLILALLIPLPFRI